MSDLYIREKPRERVETQHVHVAIVKTGDVFGLWKKICRDWHDFQHAMMNHKQRMPKIRLKADTEAKGIIRDPDNFGVFFAGERDELWLRVVSTHVSSPTVAVRSNWRAVWHEETYSHFDDSQEWLEDLRFLLLCHGVDVVNDVKWEEHFAA